MGIFQIVNKYFIPGFRVNWYISEYRKGVIIIWASFEVHLYINQSS